MAVTNFREGTMFRVDPAAAAQVAGPTCRVGLTMLPEPCGDASGLSAGDAPDRP
jgi:hypothetical protein